MRLRIYSLIFLLLCLPAWGGTNYAKKFPTGTAIEVVTPTSGDATYLRLDTTNAPLDDGSDDIDFLDDDPDPNFYDLVVLLSQPMKNSHKGEFDIYNNNKFKNNRPQYEFKKPI